MLFLDPRSLKDIPGSRNPNGVREWLDSRVANGFDKKSIKAMLRLSEEELSQVCDCICYIFSCVLLKLFSVGGSRSNNITIPN